MVKLIAFDVWQTLADYPFNLYEEVLKITKLPLTLQEFILKKGEAEVSSSLNDKDRFLEKMRIMGVKDESILEKVSDLYYEAHSNIFIYGDVLETLLNLKEKGYTLALITNVDSYAQERVIKLFPDDLFEEIIASFEVGFKKPQKEIFLKLSENKNLNPNEIVMVGDGLATDIIPPSELGWKTVFINRKGEICDKADYNISSIGELSEIF